MKLQYQAPDAFGNWRLETRTFPEPLARLALGALLARLKEDRVEVIVGPRQSGKTTLLRMTMNTLRQQGVAPDRIFYVDLDTVLDRAPYENPRLFLETVTSAGGRGRKYVFLDEVQRLRDPGLFLKGLHDLGGGIKLFASGSSSLEIRAQTREYLTGRKRETRLLPLSFGECVRRRKLLPDWTFTGRLNRKNLTKWREAETAWGRYLAATMDQLAVAGGYPAVVMAKSGAQRTEELGELYNSYVRKDVADFLKVERIEIFNRLVKALATQTGNLMNRQELAGLVQANVLTVEKYLAILQDTFVTCYLPPFTTSRRNEIKHAHKVFFIDSGLRNFALKSFAPLADRVDKGALLENLVAGELLKGLGLDEELFFWRTKAGAEVDFVLQAAGGVIPIEVKAGPAQPGTLPKSFHAFLDKFKPATGILLNRDRFEIVKVKGTTIYYLPIHWFLLLGPAFIGKK